MKNVLKILFIIDHLGCGGAERITLQLAEYLAKNKNHIIHLAVLNGKANYHFPSTNITYTDLDLSESFAFGKMWKDKKLNASEIIRLNQLLLNNFDLIVTGYNNGHWLGPYLKGNVWHWIHGDLLEIRPQNNLFKKMKEQIRFAKNKRKFKKLFSNRNIITVNRDLENKTRLYANIQECQTIANGVEIPTDLLNKYIYSQKKWDTIFVGRLAPIKQVDHAIQAFAQSGLKGKMAIIGDGSERKNLEKLTKELNITDHIEFLGWVNNPLDYINNSRSLILTSHYESYGLVLAEAISLNTPVIAYNTSSGINDIFCCNTMHEFLIESNNIDLLALKLKKLVDHPYKISHEIIKNINIKKTAENFINLAKKRN